MGPHGINIRLAQASDAQSIALMSRDLIETGLGWKYDAPRVLRAIRERETVALVAEVRGAVVGFAIMEFGDERAHLVLLAVQPVRRRRGVGRALLDWLVDSARTAGMESVHLELRAANAAARAFYRAMGFSETLTVPGYYRGREAALRMLRMLRQPGPASYTWRPPTLGQK